MTNAVITQTTYNAPQDTAGFISAIVTACQNAGMGSVFDSYNNGSGDPVRVFKIDSPNAGGKSFYFNVWVLTTGTAIRGVQTQIYETWNATTHTGTNASSAYSASSSSDSYSYTNNQPINLYAINHPEFRGVTIQQSGSTTHTIGFLKPFNIPSWWAEISFPYGFMHVSGASLYNFYPLGTGANALATGSACNILYSSAMSFVNPYNNKRDIYNGLLLLPDSSNGNRAGIIGKTSNDLCLVCASGLSLFDVVQVTPGSEEYTLITAGGTPGIAIRTT
ncbi:hypothetical protein [Tolypothrix sp. PCC 7601]|uniref:hypothetical protein n=1 Tax=Tolypothrix sp. PCC 7601 TaxID=1188 RepID=UPI0021DFD67E|nr:hypothetical protein [Tolypothrix sp. PCC 7601]UYD38984.1 hypothetical protein HG267_41435 [Tolypothrix sp. PCC 7601]